MYGTIHLMSYHTSVLNIKCAKVHIYICKDAKELFIHIVSNISKILCIDRALQYGLGTLEAKLVCRKS